MELLKQIRVAVVGIPDCGKSTFIKEVVKVLAGREPPIDVLMNEQHYSDGKDIYGNADTRTIKAAKIFFKYKDMEFCFYDCAGHIEYAEQIQQGLDSASIIIKIIDSNRLDDSLRYFCYDIFNVDKPCITLWSHSEDLGKYKYNIYDAPKHFNNIAVSIVDEIYSMAQSGEIAVVDIEEEAKGLIHKILSKFENIGMFFSGGKDSLVGLELLRQCGYLNKINVLFPCSEYDFNELLDQIEEYRNLYGVTITSFCNNGGFKPNELSVFQWMQQKAFANDTIIKENGYDLILVQYRASDEGVRSKDYHITDKITHNRFSPVFYFSESNIWRFIDKYNLPVCSLYYKGYRSLGDNFCTEPCMPTYNNIRDIIEYIDNNQHTNERDGRKKQDETEQYTMEKLRNVGFF